MRKFSFIILSFLLFLSCQKVRIFKDYYSDGTIKSIEYFQKKGIFPFLKIDYYQTGEIKDSIKYDSSGALSGISYFNFLDEGYYRWTEYQKGKASGNSFVFKKDGTRIIQHFKNDSLNGVEVKIFPSGFRREVFWSNDLPLFSKEIETILPGDTLLTTNNKHAKLKFEQALEKYVLVNAYIIKNHKEIIIGTLEMDTLWNVGSSNSNSYVNSILDSSNLCIIGYFQNLKNISMKIEFGKMNGYDFIPFNNQSYIDDSGNLKICVSIEKIIDENNCILGKVNFIRKNQILFETYFFEYIPTEKRYYEFGFN